MRSAARPRALDPERTRTDKIVSRRGSRAAADLLGKRGGERLTLLVQEMVDPVAEILVGARVDPEFGPIVVVGAGGVMVELYRDVAIRLAPVTEDVALQMIGETRAAALLSALARPSARRPTADGDGRRRAVSAHQ